MKFAKPKNSAFYHHCNECDFWIYQQTIGTAHLGVCNAIEERPDERDAFSPPCGLFKKRSKNGNKRSV